MLLGVVLRPFVSARLIYSQPSVVVVGIHSFSAGTSLGVHPEQAWAFWILN
jgi:hypothetical protein